MSLSRSERKERNKKIADRKAKAGYTKDIPDSCKTCKFFRPGVKGSTLVTDAPWCEHPDNFFHVEPQAICDFYKDKDDVPANRT